MLATAGEGASIWTLEGEIGLTGNAVVGVAPLAAVALEGLFVVRILLVSGVNSLMFAER